jgi:hypothetical protein
VNRLLPLLGLLAGIAIGLLIAHFSRPVQTAEVKPADWVARVGEQYITPDMVRAELLRRGGMQPGQFQTDEQKRALLDDMLLHLALVDAARRAGLDQQPETRRSIEQLLTSQYIADTLRQQQNQVSISDDEVQAWFDQHSDSYSLRARRRVAMLRIAVPASADAATWSAAELRANEALDKARKLDNKTLHFGVVAREYSDEQSSRYRGGVIGWLTEGRQDQYRHDPVLIKAAFALQQPGAFSPVLRGADGVYVARLVETQAAQKRGFEQLRAGILQRLQQDRYQQIERDFRAATLNDAPIELRESALAAIEPPGPPARSTEPQPPAMPGEQEPTP